MAFSGQSNSVSNNARAQRRANAISGDVFLGTISIQVGLGSTTFTLGAYDPGTYAGGYTTTVKNNGTFKDLGYDDSVTINPSGGPLAANPVMSAGLIRIGEAASRISSGQAHRAVAHATSGPCLQQNLVCVLEGE